MPTTLTKQLWQHKAKALDKYRWLLLRQRHGIVGTATRFFRDAVRDLLFGSLAYINLRHKRDVACSNQAACDFLLLQSSPKVIPLKRKKKLMEQLTAKKYTLIEIAQLEPFAAAHSGCFCQPPQPVPIRYLGYAAYAEWLIHSYNPRIVLNDRNGSLLSPFLRLSLNSRDKTLVHLAHATTLEKSRRLNMMDYDYYFLFGKSSLAALQKRPLRFGTTNAVMTGSHMIDSAYALAPHRAPQKNILVLGVGPDKEKLPSYIDTYTMLARWADNNRDYTLTIKKHPRSSTDFWAHAATTTGNIVILPAGYPLSEALQEADIVINIVSNAVMEAALAKRPVIYVNNAATGDIFEQERFFGERVDNERQLSDRINNIRRHYQQSVQQSADFAAYHLHNGCCGLQATVTALERLINNLELGSEKISSTVN